MSKRTYNSKSQVYVRCEMDDCLSNDSSGHCACKKGVIEVKSHPSTGLPVCDNYESKWSSSDKD